MDGDYPTCSTNCNNIANDGYYCGGLGCQCQPPYSDDFSACVQVDCPSSSDFQEWIDYVHGYCGSYGGFTTDSNAATATAAGAASSTTTPDDFAFTPSTLATVAASSGGSDGSGAAAATTTSIDNEIEPSSPATHHSFRPHSAARHGLSKGAKGGIGAGVTIAVLVALVLGRFLLMLYRRGRKRQTVPVGAPAQEVGQIQQLPPPPPQAPDASISTGQPAQVNAYPVYPLPKYSHDETVREVVANDEGPVAAGGNVQGHGEATIRGE